MKIIAKATTVDKNDDLLSKDINTLRISNFRNDFH